MDLQAWIDIAQASGPLAQQFGTAIASWIQNWWNGSETQVDLGQLTVYVNQDLQIRVLKSDFEVAIKLPNYDTITSLGGTRDDQVRYTVPGSSALVIQCKNDNGPWACQVYFNRAVGNPLQWEQPPCLQVDDGGNDNLWPNRRRLYLARLNVIP